MCLSFNDQMTSKHTPIKLTLPPPGLQSPDDGTSGVLLPPLFRMPPSLTVPQPD